MKFNEVQTLVEQYVKDTAATLSVAVAYENLEFNSDIYNKYVKCTVRFGDSIQKAVESCYRVVGLLCLDIHTRPSKGVVNQLTLADQLTPYFVKKILVATPPLVAPEVQFLVPELVKGTKEINGWVIDNYSCPFFYNVRY